MSADQDDDQAIVEDYLEDEDSGHVLDTQLRHRRGPPSTESRQQIQGNKSSSDGNNNDSLLRRQPSLDNPVQEEVKCSSDVPSKDQYINSLNQWMTSLKVWRSYQDCLAASLMASSMMSVGGTVTRRNGFESIATPEVVRPIQVDPPRMFRMYRVPKIWKRVAAEGFDFMILLLIKLIATFIAIDYFELIDLSKFDTHALESFKLLESNGTQGMDNEVDVYDAYRIALEFTSEILVIELMHRVIVIIYETIFLMGNLFSSRPPLVPGASTPGKMMMGLKVVYCTKIEEMPREDLFQDRVVMVYGAADLGLGWSLLRSIIKNFSSVFFIPASLTMFISDHNRAAYDIACRCLVVEP